MQSLLDSLQPIFSTFCLGVITVIITWLSANIEKKLNEWADTNTKKQVVRDCCKAVEQLYQDLHGDEKLDKCIESATEILNEKGIMISDLELRTLIQSAVKSLNSVGWVE